MAPPPAPPIPAPPSSWPQPQFGAAPGVPGYPTSPGVQPTPTSPPPQPSGGPRTRTVVGVVVGLLLVAIGVSAFLVAQGLSGLTLVSNLERGECVENFFNEGNNGEFEEIFFVGTTDCSNPHAYEVFATTDLLWSDSVYPGADEAYFDGEALCLSQYDEFVGGDFWSSPYDVVTFVPTPDGWEQGDRSVQCLVGYEDGVTTVTGSLENAGRGT